MTNKNFPSDNIVPFSSGAGGDNEPAPMDISQVLEIMGEAFEASGGGTAEEKQKYTAEMMENLAQIADHIGDENESIHTTDPAMVYFEKVRATEGVREKEAILREAVKEFPNSYISWLTLSWITETLEESLEVLEKGILVGREEFKDFLPPDGEEADLWGHPSARNFLELYHEKGDLEFIGGLFEEAIFTYKEALRLSKNDNMGLRENLYITYLYQHDFKSIRELGEKFPNDSILGWVVSKAIMTFEEEAADLTDEQIGKITRTLSKANMKTFKKYAPKSYNAFIKLKNRNPFFLEVISTPSILEMDDPEDIMVGHASEAIATAKLCYELFQELGLPLLVAQASQSFKPKDATEEDIKLISELFSKTMDYVDKEGLLE